MSNTRVIMVTCHDSCHGDVSWLVSWWRVMTSVKVFDFSSYKDENLQQWLSNLNVDSTDHVVEIVYELESIGARPFKEYNHYYKHRFYIPVAKFGANDSWHDNSKNISHAHWIQGRWNFIKSQQEYRQIKGDVATRFSVASTSNRTTRREKSSRFPEFKGFYVERRNAIVALVANRVVICVIFITFHSLRHSSAIKSSTLDASLHNHL